MPALLLGLSAYSRADGALAPVRLVNLIPEDAPTSPTGKVLLGRPGLEEVQDWADLRGVYRDAGVFDNDLFSVAGTTLRRDTTTLGTVSGDDRIEWAYTVDGLFVLGGGIVYQYDGSTLEATAFPDDAAVASLAQIDNILVAVRQDTGTVYFRLPGDTTWNGLDYFSAEREPDPAIAVRQLNDLLYVFGRSSVELFAPTGDATVPFGRVDGASFARGCKDRDSIVGLDNTLFFVGEDSVAYRADSVPQRISDHGIEERLRQSLTASAFSFSWDGHKLWVVELDGETLAYDVASGSWIQLTYDGGRFPGLGWYDGVDAYVGGAKLWKLADRADDDGQEMERVFTSIAPVNAPVTCHALEVILSPGVSEVDGEQAIVQTRLSRDQGRTWGDWRDAQIGFSGEYRKRARLRRWGMLDAPGAAFEHRITDPVKVRFSGVEMNPPLGGRSR